jgi:hypothetical protein
MKMKVTEFIKRLEKLSKTSQQLVIAEWFGVTKSLEKLDMLEEILKEYEIKEE